METCVVAYSVVWLALLVYVTRLGMRQRQLMRIAGALKSRIEQGRRGVVQERSEMSLRDRPLGT